MLLPTMYNDPWPISLWSLANVRCTTSWTHACTWLPHVCLPKCARKTHSRSWGDSTTPESGKRKCKQYHRMMDTTMVQPWTKDRHILDLLPAFNSAQQAHEWWRRLRCWQVATWHVWYLSSDDPHLHPRDLMLGTQHCLKTETPQI